MFPFLGIATVMPGADFDVAGGRPPVVPYYRFMNATAAPMALVGLGAFAAILWFWRKDDPKLGPRGDHRRPARRVVARLARPR